MKYAVVVAGGPIVSTQPSPWGNYREFMYRRQCKKKRNETQESFAAVDQNSF